MLMLGTCFGKSVTMETKHSETKVQLFLFSSPTVLVSLSRPKRVQDAIKRERERQKERQRKRKREVARRFVVALAENKLPLSLALHKLPSTSAASASITDGGCQGNVRNSALSI